MQSKLFFYGGAGAVTGSNFMLDLGTAKFLVDCGMRQGRQEDEAGNAKPFEYDPASVSHLIITHAHIDHVGRIPKLVRDGFKGKIISTHATRAIAEPLLKDALERMQDAKRKHGEEPIFDAHDIARTMEIWEAHGYHQKIALPEGVELELLNAGHILGSSMVQFTRQSDKGARRVVITGDLGGGNSPLLSLVEDPKDVNYLVMESVYGDRTRPDDGNRRDQLENAIEDAVARGGALLIPAFSTERTQDLLFEIRALMVEKRVPSVPVFLDSPLAEEITDSYLKEPDYFAPAIAARVRAGENIFAFPELKFVKTPEESHDILKTPGSKIILAGSGMGQGGRVIGHEQVLLPESRNTVLLVGYQAAGTTGRLLYEAVKSIKIFGKPVSVKAHVEAIFGYSAHMDGEALLEFANKTKGASPGLREIFVVEGEPAAASFLAQRIRDYLGTKATTPDAGQSATIDF